MSVKIDWRKVLQEADEKSQDLQAFANTTSLSDLKNTYNTLSTLPYDMKTKGVKDVINRIDTAIRMKEEIVRANVIKKGNTATVIDDIHTYDDQLSGKTKALEKDEINAYWEAAKEMLERDAKEKDGKVCLGEGPMFKTLKDFAQWKKIPKHMVLELKEAISRQKDAVSQCDGRISMIKERIKEVVDTFSRKEELRTNINGYRPYNEQMVRLHSEETVKDILMDKLKELNQKMFDYEHGRLFSLD